jgi:hypothetical protein
MSPSVLAGLVLQSAAEAPMERQVVIHPRLVRPLLAAVLALEL